MNLRRAVREIRRHWADRTWWHKRFLTHVVSRYYDVAGHDAVPVVAEDWDTLVVLDACRYDLFAEVLADHPLPGSLDRRNSMETGTPGFLAENFAGGTFHDTVYVTANPYVSTDLEADQFHAVDHVWRDGWDEEFQTVLPETMRDRALAAHERYPDKRLVVHFMQPHTPFIGERRLGGKDVFAIREVALGNEEPDPRSRRRTPFEQLQAGEVTREEVWGAYRANLERALTAVEDLLTELDGKTAVTSDHGNAFGEFASPFPIRVYGHPLGILIPALVEVPWHVHECGPRRTIRAESPNQSETPVDTDTQERLRMLGYAE